MKTYLHRIPPDEHEHLYAVLGIFLRLRGTPCHTLRPRCILELGQPDFEDFDKLGELRAGMELEDAL